MTETAAFLILSFVTGAVLSTRLTAVQVILAALLGAGLCTIAARVAISWPGLGPNTVEAASQAFHASLLVLTATIVAIPAYVCLELARWILGVLAWISIRAQYSSPKEHDLDAIKF